MNTKGWAALNNYVLWPASARRGENTLIPGKSGRRINPRRKDQTTKSMEVLIIGDCNASGVAYPNKLVGLETNWGLICSGILSSDVAVTAHLTMPSGADKSGYVQVDNPALASTDTGSALLFSFDLIIPAGELT